MTNIIDNTIPNGPEELIAIYSDMIAESCPATADLFEGLVCGITNPECIRTTAQNYLTEVGIEAE
jgi:hypothetical protein